jgi:alpha-tubulin suppressor-like RCC1 family protein
MKTRKTTRTLLVSFTGLLALVLPSIGGGLAHAESSGPRVGSGYSHGCARKFDGTLWCWGANDSGQLGDGTGVDHASPAPVMALGNGVVEVSVGDLFSCARRADSTLWCWGSNVSGQLGNGSFDNSLAPTQVSALGAAVAEVSAGDLFACARKLDGTVWCWGTGPLGNGAVTSSATPVQVAALGTAAAEVSTGDGAACARKTDGTLWCWGSNTFGVVGDGTTTDRLSPVQVTALGANVTGVSVGDIFACGVMSDGSVWCWGANDHGQLGDGTTTNHSLPMQVPTLHNVATVSADGRHACAHRRDGTLACWGWNAHGELGDGTTSDRSTPVAVSALGTSVAEVSAGINHNSCSVLADSSIWCWGGNEFGQVGDGTAVTRPAPVLIIAAAPAVPAGGTWLVAALGGLLAAFSLRALRRRASGSGRRVAAGLILGTALAGLVVTSSGCSMPNAGEEGTGPGPAPGQDAVGSVSVALEAAPGLHINSVAYEITRGTFRKSGSLDVSQSTILAGTIGGLPAGSGYTIALSAADTTNQLSCAGSGGFNVTAGTTASVPVHMTCHLVKTPPPAVPIPGTATAVLALLLLAAGVRRLAR